MSAMVSQITGVSFVCSTVGSGADQEIHQSSASLAFVWVIHRWHMNSPHKRPVTRIMFSFDDVIMKRTNWVFVTAKRPLSEKIKDKYRNEYMRVCVRACLWVFVSWSRTSVQTFWVQIFLSTSCSGYELSWIWVVQGKSCLGKDLFRSLQVKWCLLNSTQNICPYIERYDLCTTLILYEFLYLRARWFWKTTTGYVTALDELPQTSFRFNSFSREENSMLILWCSLC